jgi:hypothetical protein
LREQRYEFAGGITALMIGEGTAWADQNIKAL